MKKVILHLILCTLLPLCLFISCNKDDENPQYAYYAVAAKDTQLESLTDLSNWTTIQNAYKEAMAAIDGAEVDFNGKVCLKGDYDKSDAKIKAACVSVEEELSSIRLDGYLTMYVTATYSTKPDPIEIYSCSYGN